MPSVNDQRQNITRSPNGQNFHRWLEGFGVKVRHFREGRTFHTRPANVVYGGRTLKRLWANDAEKASTVIRCIQISNPRCFDDYTLLAIWHFIGAHFGQSDSPAAVQAFRGVDLGKISHRAHRLAKGEYGRMGKVAEKISSLLADAILPEDEAA